MTNTEVNLQTAISGEARARLKYTAFGLQALEEGHPEIAQLFLEAAGAETGSRHEPPACGGRRGNDEG
jgi:rubrerythrin